jgi:hypothetical protein
VKIENFFGELKRRNDEKRPQDEMLDPQLIRLVKA